MNERLNEIGRNNKGTPMKIIRYGNAQDIDVEFLDGFHYVKRNQTYVNFKRGTVKNPYDKTICNVGFIGDGEFKTGTSKKHSPEYQNWTCMIRRCYDDSLQDRYSAYYSECEVCDQWHNFQTFARWWNENIYQVGTERMHIDKDILYPGNKIYSPQKCLIVPQRINMIFTNKSNERSLPNGVVHYESGYLAKYNTKELGIYETLEEAYNVYAIEKEKHIKQIADEYKELIPENVYKALYDYKVYMEYDKNIQAA